MVSVAFAAEDGPAVDVEYPSAPIMTAMADTEQNSRLLQDNRSFTRLDADLIIADRVVMTITPVEPFLPYSGNSTGRSCFMQLSGIVFIPNSTVFYFVLYGYCKRGEPLQTILSRISFRKADLGQVNRGMKAHVEDKVVTYWWPMSELVGLAAASPSVTCASATPSPSSIRTDSSPPTSDSFPPPSLVAGPSSPSISAYPPSNAASPAAQVSKESSSSSSHSRNLGIMVAWAVSSLALICAIACVAFFASKARQQQRWQSAPNSEGFKMTKTITSPPSTAKAIDQKEREEPRPMEVKRFSLAVLSHCRSDFSQSYRIGDSGAFGDVYWGSIGENQQLAIKLMSGNLTPAKRSMFLAEVNTLSRLHHANLIRLVGYCDQGNRSILVYPYFPGGSLYARLHTREKAVPDRPLLPPLTLMERLCIPLQIAKGLAYLHDGVDPPIIHRDIKSSNVLLGDGTGKKLRAVVADFGLAAIGERVFGTERQTVVKTSHMAGTFGYMAPEYMLSGIVSEKIDVYAFGVILLELLSLTGRKAVSPSPSGAGWQTLVDWARPRLGRRHGAEPGVVLYEILEPCLRDQAAGLQFNQAMMETLRLAAECIVEDYECRPTMSMLEATIASLLNEANVCSWQY
ncbi:hypothetical protein CBR_g23635 [Chara braunii]|uniref:Protein kinase domain-containing protein n=1 Tax=Chara braunii TaxID=69332 RepID=A0A388L4S6_CHABU|nr:hypothetical protein CBR_g23635 [Chara braunii]|eukprot:GBG77305.1 hypothetical protein CBR_g23635 [Chara braunii]